MPKQRNSLLIRRRNFELKQVNFDETPIKKTLKAHEEKRRRKFKKDQALRIRQEKLQKNLHKLGVDLKETTLPLDLPLTAPIYLPLGTTLVLSDISSIKIEYSNTCATVEHGKNSRIGLPFQH
jgi:hypothetical protein